MNYKVTDCLSVNLNKINVSYHNEVYEGFIDYSPNKGRVILYITIPSLSKQLSFNAVNFKLDKFDKIIQVDIPFDIVDDAIVDKGEINVTYAD